MITLGIILGSTRPGRVGAQVTDWVMARAARQPGLRVHLLDLAEIGLPFLDEAAHPSEQRYTQQHTHAWSRSISAVDAVVLVTPEYNSSFPASLKNALDFLYLEWQRKPVGLVGYGNTSAGTRAVAALLPVVVSLGMVPAGAVQLPLRQRIDGAGTLQVTAADDAGIDGLLKELVELVDLLQRVPAAAS